MSDDTNSLIDTLAREAQPVTPLAAPWTRAGAFVMLVAGVMGAFVLYAGQPRDTFAHLLDMPFAAELIGAVLAAICAIVAAVMLAIPGRSPAWIYLPLPGVLLWLIGGGVDCYRAMAAGFEPTSLLSSLDCFWFILFAGVPVAAAAYMLLRRTVPVDLLPVTALAGLGAALSAAAMLQFMHAHGTNPVDFVTHVVAVAAVTVFMVALGRIGLRRG